jgi:hypothetical protein
LAVAVMSIVGSSPAGADSPVDFNRDIRPLFNRHCVACHGGVKRAGGLSLLDPARAMGETESGAQAIVPGAPEQSELWLRISSDDESIRMPPADHAAALDRETVGLFERWIREGADWSRHWAYVPPIAHAPPSSDDPSWCDGPVDAFIQQGHAVEGLNPSAPEAPDRWMRRVALDLTGLPPEPHELQRFLNDHRPDARQRAIDRLLANPATAERWCADWLDLARYADTQGFEKDSGRTIWPYRDWVLDAIAADLPFDQFSIRQLAGDLLPEASVQDRVATGFHRNTQTNTEGGTDDEEFRLAAAMDRVSTTWQVWQATTIGCVQCHSHPYDPIEHEEYYRALAVFNTSKDFDLPDDWPRQAVPREAGEWPRMNALESEIESLEAAQFGAIFERAQRSHWEALQPRSASTTGTGQLTISPAVGEQPGEVLADGTLTNRSRFDMQWELPPLAGPLTAIRLEAFPRDPESARRIPEAGFVVSRIHLYWIEGEQPPRELPLAWISGDEPRAYYGAERSTDDDVAGWAAYPRMGKQRWAVCVLTEPLALSSNGRLQVVLEHNDDGISSQAAVVRRLRMFGNDDPRWTELVSSQPFKSRRERLESLQAERSQLAVADVPVMEEQSAGDRRETFVFTRGNWLTTGTAVTAGVPATFGELAAPADRLAFAQHLFAPENPLTARVFVNRAWEQLFGQGLVSTLEDFGSQGQPPSHPELLDWLAVNAQQTWQWSRARLLRELVASATYGQSASSPSSDRQHDPANRWYARGPRQRLTAEMVRDQALSVSGLLDRRIGGPPVMPYQPEGVWRTVYNSSQWETSPGGQAHRRAVYTYWRRTSPYPAGMIFDATSREVCTLRRFPTNTPLQALAVLNDEAMLRASQALGEQMWRQPTVSDAVRWGFRRVAGREVDHATARVLEQLFAAAVQNYQADPAACQPVASDAARYAAIIVAQALLNTDSVLMR